MTDEKWGVFGAYQEAARAMLAALESIKWKSMDIDNMEFNCAITYVQMDAIRAAIAQAEAAGIGDTPKAEQADPVTADDASRAW